MRKNYSEMPNGYLETIDRGVRGIRQMRGGISYGKGTPQENLERLKEELRRTDAVVIGAGAGLSTAAGFIYTGERFEKWFPDFIRKYRIRDMYSGGFFPYPSKEIFWAYWARYIYINRYLNPPKPVYADLLSAVKGKDYFVITTNVDHCFQRAGFDKSRLFYTQGDYGLFQSTNPAVRKTWSNEEWVCRAMEAQGFEKTADGTFEMPENGQLRMEIPSGMIPVCPEDGSDFTMNLRSDDSFVEDSGWHAASAAYAEYLERLNGRPVLFLEIGVGNNTPVIIKYPFWQMTKENSEAVYACLNHSRACCPEEIEDRSILISGDCAPVIRALAES